MKYLGVMQGTPPELTVWTHGGDELLIHIKHHSPSGFAAGYLGSGPADLALSLCVDVLYRADRNQNLLDLGEYQIPRLAWDAHQFVKQEIVARLPFGSDWEIDTGEILACIDAYAERRSRGVG